MASGFASPVRAATSISPIVWWKVSLNVFWLLARYPLIGRRRDDDLRLGLRSFPADDYVIIHRILEDDLVLILHVVHSSRDIEALFGR
jgi:plasmid stabilization system protein ParE